MGDTYEIKTGNVGGSVVAGSGNQVSFGSKSGGTYLDVVLTTGGEVLFNGTPEDTKAWLTRTGHGFEPDMSWTVVIGESMKVVYINQYLGR